MLLAGLANWSQTRKTYLGFSGWSYTHWIFEYIFKYILKLNIICTNFSILPMFLKCNMFKNHSYCYPGSIFFLTILKFTMYLVLLIDKLMLFILQRKNFKHMYKLNHNKTNQTGDRTSKKQIKNLIHIKKSFQCYHEM